MAESGVVSGLFLPGVCLQDVHECISFEVEDNFNVKPHPETMVKHILDHFDGCETIDDFTEICKVVPKCIISCEH